MNNNNICTQTGQWAILKTTTYIFNNNKKTLNLYIVLQYICKIINGLESVSNFFLVLKKCSINLQVGSNFILFTQ